LQLPLTSATWEGRRERHEVLSRRDLLTELPKCSFNEIDQGIERAPPVLPDVPHPTAVGAKPQLSAGERLSTLFALAVRGRRSAF
jgi:hypothetical protein